MKSFVWALEERGGAGARRSDVVGGWVFFWKSIWGYGQISKSRTTRAFCTTCSAWRTGRCWGRAAVAPTADRAGRRRGGGRGDCGGRGCLVRSCGYQSWVNPCPLLLQNYRWFRLRRRMINFLKKDLFWVPINTIFKQHTKTDKLFWPHCSQKFGVKILWLPKMVCRCQQLHINQEISNYNKKRPLFRLTCCSPINTIFYWFISIYKKLSSIQPNGWTSCQLLLFVD